MSLFGVRSLTTSLIIHHSNTGVRLRRVATEGQLVEICWALLGCRHKFRVSTIISLNLEDKFHQRGLGDCLILVTVYFTSLCALKICEENCTALIGMGGIFRGWWGCQNPLENLSEAMSFKLLMWALGVLRRLSTFITFGIQGSVKKSGSWMFCIQVFHKLRNLEDILECTWRNVTWMVSLLTFITYNTVDETSFTLSLFGST